MGCKAPSNPNHDSILWWFHSFSSEMLPLKPPEFPVSALGVPAGSSSRAQPFLQLAELTVSTFDSHALHTIAGKCAFLRCATGNQLEMKAIGAIQPHPFTFAWQRWRFPFPFNEHFCRLASPCMQTMDPLLNTGPPSLLLTTPRSAKARGAVEVCRRKLRPTKNNFNSYFYNPLQIF